MAHYIGEKYGGGIVFYVNGEKGLIAAPADLGDFDWETALYKCKELNLDGYQDWYLPNQDELDKLYQNIGPVAPAPNTNVGGFARNVYWSSSDFGNIGAWFQYFGGGSQVFGSKAKAARVRAVRAY